MAATKSLAHNVPTLPYRENPVVMYFMEVKSKIRMLWDETRAVQDVDCGRCRTINPKIIKQSEQVLLGNHLL
jgi:hypothetical protein